MSNMSRNRFRSTVTSWERKWSRSATRILSETSKGSSSKSICESSL